jgi:glycine betaine/proline transport system permease protein
LLALFRRYRLAVIGVFLLAFFLALRWSPWDANTFPEAWNLGLRAPLDDFRSWVIGNQSTHWLFVYFFDPLSAGIDWGIRGVENIFLWLPWPLTILLFTLLGYKLGGTRLAVLSAVCLLIMGLLGLWVESMQTLALMVISVLIALIIGIPLGILSARNERVEAALRPLLDAMQTMPAFVYLIPVLLFFGIGRVPAVIATVIYALPPAIRLTAAGIRQVPAETVEAAVSFGSTESQKLTKVQLPLALPSILAGVNQTIMMALGIVVIAALVGAGGLGREVLNGLQRLQVGQAFEAGLAIVFLAVLLDRLSAALVTYRQDYLKGRPTQPQRPPAWQTRLPTFLQRYGFLLLLGGLFAGLIFLDQFVLDLQAFPDVLRLSLRAPVDAAVAWMRDNLYEIGDTGLGAGPLSDFITLYLLSPLRNLFEKWLPWPLLIAIVGVIAGLIGGLRLGILSALGMLALGLLSMWPQSMDTLSQTLVAVLLSVVIAVPLGILAAKRPRVDVALRPILDFLQTIPPFVYLVPVIMLFNVGRVPGIIASVLYALPPAIRLTTLGLRQVSAEAIEAATAFGSTPRQMLFKVELPLAKPTIMLGVNQAVMMVLSMVIIAGLVGGAGLGLESIIGLAKNETGRGVEAGIAIVILAMILDRMTQGLAKSRQ